MKKKAIFIIALLISINCNSANLITVFQQALTNDMVYQQAVTKALSHQEDIALARAYLLPNVQLDSQPFTDAQANSGAITRSSGIAPELQPPHNHIRSFDMRLTVSQPIFNFAIFSRFNTSKLIARESAARLNAQLQDLMLRVSEAYFNVLRSEKTVAYLLAHKKSLAKQLYNVQQKYSAGKTTKTYVYMAKSAYSAAESDYVSAETQLASDKEYLTQLTSIDNPYLADLHEKIPLVSPEPSNVEQWEKKALQNNWLIKANQLNVQAAREEMKQHFSDHLPTANVQVYYDNQSFHMSQGSLLVAAGSSRTVNSAALININVPIYSGGLVVAATRKAQYKFQLSQQKLDSSVRKTKFNVHRSYANILSNIKKIQYQKSTIQSALSSLHGVRARYSAGSGNLTDVLDQQAKLLEAQMQYESARYTYIIELLRLKKSAGTLSADDLQIVTSWLKT